MQPASLAYSVTLNLPVKMAYLGLTLVSLIASVHMILAGKTLDFIIPFETLLLQFV